MALKRLVSPFAVVTKFEVVERLNGVGHLDIHGANMFDLKRYDVLVGCHFSVKTAPGFRA